MVNKFFKVNKSTISPGNFFSKEEEKTKLNWFLFEFARELESYIHQRKTLCNKLNKKGVNKKALAAFCVHYSKQMKSQILDQVSGRIANVQIGYDEIEACFPKIGDSLIDEILTSAAEAWDSQTLRVCHLSHSLHLGERLHSNDV